MDAPLFEKLQKHSQSGAQVFAMPGHKGRGLFAWDWRMDVTELFGLDNLHQAQGVIAQAQEKAAALRGADGAFFLVNGSSGGLMAAVLAVAGPGEEILVARNCHVSVFRGLMLAGAEPVYVEPAQEAGIPRGISADAVATALSEHPQAKAVVVVSPTYEGFCSPIPELARLCHDRGLPLIVDAAHGAHFGYHPVFPQSALAQGADVVVESWHKTLPAPTQSSVLFYQGSRVDRDRLQGALRLTQSTSPSYFLMGALDRCRAFLETEGPAAFAAYAESLLALREKIQGLGFPKLLPTDDVGKLVFLTGPWLEEALREQQIFLEAAWPTHCLAMTSVADRPEDFDRLFEALSALPAQPTEAALAVPPCPLPPRRLSLREAFFAPGEGVPLAEAAGRVALDFLVPYPPGIPLVCPGEEITPAAVAHLQGVLLAGGSVVGLEKMVVVKKE